MGLWCAVESDPTAAPCKRAETITGGPHIQLPARQQIYPYEYTTARGRSGHGTAVVSRAERLYFEYFCVFWANSKHPDLGSLWGCRMVLAWCPHVSPCCFLSILFCSLGGSNIALFWFFHFHLRPAWGRFCALILVFDIVSGAVSPTIPHDNMEQSNTESGRDCLQPLTIYDGARKMVCAVRMTHLPTVLCFGKCRISSYRIASRCLPSLLPAHPNNLKLFCNLFHFVIALPMRPSAARAYQSSTTSPKVIHFFTPVFIP